MLQSLPAAGAVSRHTLGPVAAVPVNCNPYLVELRSADFLTSGMAGKVIDAVVGAEIYADSMGWCAYRVITVITLPTSGAISLTGRASLPPLPLATRIVA